MPEAKEMANLCDAARLRCDAAMRAAMGFVRCASCVCADATARSAREARRSERRQGERRAGRNGERGACVGAASARAPWSMAASKS